MKLILKEQNLTKLWKAINLFQGDINSLAKLMFEAYQGTIDYQGETFEDAVEEVQDTINGKYGTLLEQCSFLIEDKGQVLSACLVTLPEETSLPLLTFAMTHPSFKNQGMGTFLIKKSINALLTQSYKELYLVVTEGNIAAQHLYEKMGFQVFE